MGVSIVALCVFSLLQLSAADPRPEFALAAPVPNTGRVGEAASEANAIISVVKQSTVGFTIRSELPLLPKVLTVVRNVANEFQTRGTAIITTLTALAGDSSGDVAGKFGEAQAAVDSAIAFAGSTLPGMTQPLVPLIGTPLVDKFDDSLQHIGKALQALKVSLDEMKIGAQNAVAEAGGSAAVPPATITKLLGRAMINRLIIALHLLRATVPVLKYTVDSTIEGLTIADQYMLGLANKVDAVIGEKSGLAADLDAIAQALLSTITGKMATVGTDLTKIVADYAALTNVATAGSAANLGTVLGLFPANLAELAAKNPNLAAVLGSLKEALMDVYDVAGQLYFIYDSELVNTLISRLVANDKFSQYCFYKYEAYLYVLLDTVTLEAKDCIDQEVRRMEYYRKTVELMLALLFYDFEDIAGDLTVCNTISDPTNLEECTTALLAIYTKLEEAFGDMFTLGYNTVSHEVTASRNRLKICMNISQSELAYTEIPLLIQKINALPIMSSGKVSQAVLNAQTVLLAVDDNTPFKADANYAALQQLADIMVGVATVTVKVGNELIPLVSSLVTDASGDVPGAFATVFSKITAVKATIAEKVPIANEAIKAVFKTRFNSVGLDYIPDQLTDGFDRIVTGLDDLTVQLQALKGAIAAAITEAGAPGAVTNTVLKKYVKPAFIYNVVFAVNQLKAYTPVVKYTIDSTLENINLADDYLVLLYKAAGASTTTNAALVASVKTVTDGIQSVVKQHLNQYTDEYGSLKTQAGALTAIPTTPDISKMNAALDSFSATFGTLQSTRYPALATQMQTLLDTMSAALSAGSTPGQISSSLLDSLILTVIENGKFAQFCFNKYLGLVFGFLTSLSDSAGLCFDKEVRRLQFLQDSIPNFGDMLPFDYELTLVELTICDQITTKAKLDECVLVISGFYGELANQFSLKIQYLFELIEAETVASANRFLICMELMKIDLVEYSDTMLTDEIRQCAAGGPTADD
uniref:Protein TsetseEP domain-containing protein n=1 Tax=Anopheles dirus TaxID=7168 RepID=A0A182NKP6_9DIPT